MVPPGALSGHRLVGLDTAIFIYTLEAHPIFVEPARRVLRHVETGQLAAVASPVLLAELLVRPYREGRRDAAQQYVATLTTFPHLRLVVPDVETCVAAGELRGRHPSLRMVDAMHIATAIRAGATAFITNDRDLSSSLPIELLQLSTLVDDFGPEE